MLNYISAQILTFMHAHTHNHDESHSHEELNTAVENSEHHQDHGREHTEGLNSTIVDTTSGIEHTHSHSSDGNVWESAWALITEPAHAITEVFYSLLFDALLIPVTILIYKKLREPKLRAQIHAEIDNEHGLDHEDCSGKISNDKTENKEL